QRDGICPFDINLHVVRSTISIHEIANIDCWNMNFSICHAAVYLISLHKIWIACIPIREFIAQIKCRGAIRGMRYGPSDYYTFLGTNLRCKAIGYGGAKCFVRVDRDDAESLSKIEVGIIPVVATNIENEIAKHGGLYAISVFSKPLITGQ